MQKRGGADILITTVILIAFAIVLAGAFIYWGTDYTEDLTEGAEEQNQESLDNVEKVKIKIQNVVWIENNAAFTVTLENKGSLVVEKVRARVILNDGEIFSDVFPSELDVNYPDGLLDIKFFEVKDFLVLDGSNNLSDYERIEFIPTVRMEDDSLQEIGDGAKEWTPR